MPRNSLAFVLLLVPACFGEVIEDMLDPPETTTSMGASGAMSTTAADAGTDTTDTDGSTTLDTAVEASGDASSGSGVASTDTTETSTGEGQTTGSETLCGNGEQEGNEQCDDGNAVEADGCLSNCTREWFVFVTSEPHTQGDIKGIVGADYQCRHRATKMFLPNGERYMAWISTSEVQPVDRIITRAARKSSSTVYGWPPVGTHWSPVRSRTRSSSVSSAKPSRRRSSRGPRRAASAWPTRRSATNGPTGAGTSSRGMASVRRSAPNGPVRSRASVANTRRSTASSSPNMKNCA